MSITHKIAQKTGVVLAGLMLVFMSAVPSAQAQSLSDLQAQINQLLAQIAALQGQQTTAGVCPYTWTRSLTNGSSGADVLKLQQFLNASADTRIATSGAGSPGMETQYFGPLTASAVSKFQVKYRSEVLTPSGLVNPTGYFGPASMTKANALCKTGTQNPSPTNPDTGELRGGAGYLNSVEFISGFNNEEVGERENDVEVGGIAIEPEGSDIELTAVRVTFDPQGTISGASDDFEDYADEVSIWLDGEEIARVDADSFTDRNNFSRTISLERGSIIREGDEEELILAISAVNNLDSADLGEEWTVEFESIRYRDAQGATITDSSTGDLGEEGPRFSFESFANAANVELSISGGDDEINDAHVINVSASNRTDGVEVLSMMVEVEGDSDVTLEEMKVAFFLTGTATELSDIASSVSLVVDGDRVSRESAVNGTDMIFDDLGLELEAGETYEFIIELDLLRLNAGTYAEGDTVSARVTTSERNDWEVEDESGEELSNTKKSGTAVGEAHAFYDIGFTIELEDVREVRSDSSSNGPGQGQYTIEYTVTPFDGDVYIDNSCTENNSGSESASAGNSYSVTNPDDNSSICSLTASGSGVTVLGDTFRVREGSTGTFTLNVVVTGENSNFAAVALEAIGWNTSNAEGTRVFDFNLPNDFKSSPLFLNGS